MGRMVTASWWHSTVEGGWHSHSHRWAGDSDGKEDTGYKQVTIHQSEHSRLLPTLNALARKSPSDTPRIDCGLRCR